MKPRNANVAVKVVSKSSGRAGVIVGIVSRTPDAATVAVQYEHGIGPSTVNARDLRKYRDPLATAALSGWPRGGIRYDTPPRVVNKGDTVTAHATAGEDDHGMHFQIRPATIEHAYDAAGPHTIRTPAPDPGGYLRGGVGEDHDPDLIERLRDLGDRYGPAGVAIVAAGLSDPNYVIARLLDTPYQAPIRDDGTRPLPDLGPLEDRLRDDGLHIEVDGRAARPATTWETYVSNLTGTTLGAIEAAAAYWDAVQAYTIERGKGPLSTTLGWVIRHGEISRALRALAHAQDAATERRAATEDVGEPGVSG